MVLFFTKTKDNFSTLSFNIVLRLYDCKWFFQFLLDYSVSLYPDKFKEFTGNVSCVIVFLLIKIEL